VGTLSQIRDRDGMLAGLLLCVLGGVFYLVDCFFVYVNGAHRDVKFLVGGTFMWAWPIDPLLVLCGIGTFFAYGVRFIVRRSK
jgi:hypothetical protein